MNMTTAAYTVAPEAKIPFALLAPKERSLLAGLFKRPSSSNMAQTTSGHYVSRLGASQRVLWNQSNSKPTILGIVDFVA